MERIDRFNVFEAKIVPLNRMPRSSRKPERSGRSGRLLTDEQKYYDENQIEDTSGPKPAMLFTDVVGSSKMWSDDPQTMSIQLDKHFKIMDNLARKYGGFVVKTIGDAFMVYFPKNEKSLENAVDFAVEVIKIEELPLRIGICSGNMTAKKCRIQNVELVDFFGDVVNTASRMESKVAEQGGIAFTSVDNIDNQMESISKKYKLVKITGKGIPDLKGVKVEFAYKLKV
jgi:class 3 adenylate cyclase